MSNFLDHPIDKEPAPFKPKRKTGRFHNESYLTQEERDEALNNFGREEVTEDFSDSPFADRV